MLLEILEQKSSHYSRDQVKKTEQDRASEVRAPVALERLACMGKLGIL